MNLKNKKIQQFSKEFSLTDIDQGLLRQAFTHSSSGKNNNERLEYLGDAVLGCVVAEKLYQLLPDAKEEYLTRLRAHLVNKHALARQAKDMNLSEFLILGQGERLTGGKQRNSILADALEALFGAIFLSQGYERARQFVLSVYSVSLQELPPEIELKDPKTRLQEWLQKRALPIPDYQVISEAGKPHAKIFTVEVCVQSSAKQTGTEVRMQATGKSRRAAEQQVAENVMEVLLSQKKSSDYVA